MSALQQKRPVKLTEDVLYIIAEKLLARIPDGRKITFCEQNPFTNFMGHNAMATRVIIAQFAKFKRIDFTKFGSDEQIEFYKKESKFSFNDSKPEEFRGPYIVPPGMLEFLIENGKLRVNTIETFNFIPDNHCSDIKGVEELNSMKAFCALFLGKQVQIPDGLTNNLMVKKFRADEPVENIQNNFEAILAIDAVELEISSRINENLIIDCSQYRSVVIAKNTTKITIDCQFDFQSSKEDIDKFSTNFETFCAFLVRACPALLNLHITICQAANSIDSSIGVFTENFYATIRAMESSIKSINTDNENLKISIDLVANFPSHIYEDLPIHQHDLFKIGTPFTVAGLDDDGGGADPHIARSLDCVDVGGRTHTVQFKIFEETHSIFSVSSAMNSDYGFDYYDHDLDDYDDYADDDDQEEVDNEDDEPY